MKNYIPDRGDVVWLNFTPQAGYEQSGTRPALVLSPMSYNKKTGLSVCCPISSKIKGYPFEVKVEGKKISGVVLSDHLKNLDWQIRKIKFIEKADPRVVKDCTAKIAALIIK